MALETGNYIFNLVSSNPTGADPKSRGDDHLRLVKSVLQNCFAGLTGPVIVSGNNGGAVNAYTLTPTPPLPSYVVGMEVLFFPTATNTGASTMNISTLGDVPIVAVNNAVLAANDLVANRPYRATYDGTSFRLNSITKNYVDQLAFNTALPAQVLGFLRSTGTVAQFSQTHTGYAQKEVRGADIASAANINLTTATGNFVHITGSGGPITSITIPSGAQYSLYFEGTPTITNSAALSLPGGADIVVEAGDRMSVRGDSTGAVVESYTRASGQPVYSVGYLKVSDRKASGTAGGATSAGVIQQRALNTTEINTIAGASLSGSVVTIPAGTYEFFGSAPIGAPNGRCKLFLFNATDSTYLGLGYSQSLPAGTTGTITTVYGRFTINGTKNVDLRQFQQNTTGASDLGAAASTGQLEVYAELELRKVA